MVLARRRSAPSRRPSPLLVVAMIGLALVGCTRDPQPDPTDVTVAGSASPTVTVPAVEKPERPEAMSRDDAEGAAAAAVYFLELYPYIMATGDTTEWDAMSFETCDSCARLREQAAEIKAKGETFSGGETTVSVTETYSRDDLTGIYPLDATISQEKQRTVDRSGNETWTLPAETSHSRIEVGRNSDAWVIVAVAPQPKD